MGGRLQREERTAAPIHGQINRRGQKPQKIGHALANCWSNVGQTLANRWPIVGHTLVNHGANVGQPLVTRWPL
eukprot:11172298-Lingulodinium_polyedra.AAC.1